MKIRLPPTRKPRIEMVPLIDTIFLLLVYFIYAMLSMSVHRGVALTLPTSQAAAVDKKTVLSVSINAEGQVFLDKARISLNDLAETLKMRAMEKNETGVLLFADKTISYQKLFEVLDIIQQSGLEKISLQAKMAE